MSRLDRALLAEKAAAIEMMKRRLSTDGGGTRTGAAARW